MKIFNMKISKTVFLFVNFVMPNIKAPTTSNLIIHLQSAGNEEIYENYLKRDQENVFSSPKAKRPRCESFEFFL